MLPSVFSLYSKTNPSCLIIKVMLLITWQLGINNFKNKQQQKKTENFISAAVFYLPLGKLPPAVSSTKANAGW